MGWFKVYKYQNVIKNNNFLFSLSGWAQIPQPRVWRLIWTSVGMWGICRCSPTIVSSHIVTWSDGHVKKSLLFFWAMGAWVPLVQWEHATSLKWFHVGHISTWNWLDILCHCQITKEWVLFVLQSTIKFNELTNGWTRLIKLVSTYRIFANKIVTKTKQQITK